MSNSSTNTLEQLCRAKTLLSDTTYVAEEITQELDIQKTKLLKIKNSVEKVDQDISFARRLVNRMKKYKTKQNIIIGSVGTLCIGALVGVIIATKK